MRAGAGDGRRGPFCSPPAGSRCRCPGVRAQGGRQGGVRGHRGSSGSSCCLPASLRHGRFVCTWRWSAWGRWSERRSSLVGGMAAACPLPLAGSSSAQMRLKPELGLSGRSSWELPDLREGRVKAISDSDGVSYPWYGNTTETVTLVGPTNKISRFSVSMNDNFYPSVTWAVPVSNSNVPLLTRIKRDQSFTTWLVAMNTTTKEKIILQTIKWRMRVDIEVDPMQLLGQRARLVGRTQQEQPRILSRMEPIPPNALVKPNANDAQVLMWRPKRGQPIVVIPPK
ncbi:protein FAM78B isoform X2 [Calonectris borealis]|uniref:protein FAM78B isoform X2 n=1 Tax=Calonectris borealis TaxID=1323832 RepID=UPI003F4B316A